MEFHREDGWRTREPAHNASDPENPSPVSIDAEESSEGDCLGCDRRGCGWEQLRRPRDPCGRCSHSRCICPRHLHKQTPVSANETNQLCLRGRPPRAAPLSRRLSLLTRGVAAGMRVTWVSSRGTGLAGVAVTVSIFIPVLKAWSLPTPRGPLLTTGPSPGPPSPRESVQTLWKGDVDG